MVKISISPRFCLSDYFHFLKNIAACLKCVLSVFAVTECIIYFSGYTLNARAHTHTHIYTVASMQRFPSRICAVIPSRTELFNV